jgi:MFS family permease
MSLKQTLIIFFLATFFQAGTYGLTFLLPPLFEGFGGEESDVGNVLGLTAASTIITVILLGQISKLFGRIKTVALACFLIAVSLYLFSIATATDGLLFCAGILLGAGWGVFYVKTPIILTGLITRDQRIRMFTLLSVFIMAGFGLSPPAAAVFQEFGLDLKNTFQIFSILSLISSGLFFFLIPSIDKHSKDIAVAKTTVNLTELTEVFRSRAIRTILMVGMGASVFAAVTNFQTVYAAERGLDYSIYFVVYTATVVIFRVIFAEFVGGRAPFGVIAFLLAVMTLSILVLLYPVSNNHIYILGALLFGIGYGVSYPIVKAMAANDAKPDLLDVTLQIFGLSYFLGVFGFPLASGWIITLVGIKTLFIFAGLLAAIEFSFALHRYVIDRKNI